MVTPAGNTGDTEGARFAKADKEERHFERLPQDMQLVIARMLSERGRANLAMASRGLNKVVVKASVAELKEQFRAFLRVVEVVLTERDKDPMKIFVEVAEQIEGVTGLKSLKEVIFNLNEHILSELKKLDIADLMRLKDSQGNVLENTNFKNIFRDAVFLKRIENVLNTDKRGLKAIKEFDVEVFGIFRELIKEGEFEMAIKFVLDFDDLTKNSMSQMFLSEIIRNPISRESAITYFEKAPDYSRARCKYITYACLVLVNDIKEINRVVSLYCSMAKQMIAKKMDVSEDITIDLFNAIFRQIFQVQESKLRLADKLNRIEKVATELEAACRITGLSDTVKEFRNRASK